MLNLGGQALPSMSLPEYSDRVAGRFADITLSDRRRLLDALFNAYARHEEQKTTLLTLNARSMELQGILQDLTSQTPQLLFIKTACEQFIPESL